MSQQPETFVGWKDAQPMFGGISRVTAWRMVRSGKLPAPVRVSPGRCAWTLSAIKEWQHSIGAKAA